MNTDTILAVVGAIISAVGLFLSYQKYVGESAKNRRAEETVNRIIMIKSLLYGFNETTKFLIQRWHIEQNGEAEDSHFETLEQVYRGQARRLADTISRMETDGTLLFLFNPGDDLFVRILALRNWLAAYAEMNHPLHSRNGQVVQELTIGMTTFEYIEVLERLSRIKPQEMHSLVKKKMDDLQLLDDLDEINRLIKIKSKFAQDGATNSRPGWSTAQDDTGETPGYYSA